MPPPEQVNEYLALVVICKGLRPFIYDICDDQGNPAPDATSRVIQWMFWQIDEQDKIAGTPSRVNAFAKYLKKNIPWSFSMTPNILIDGSFNDVDSLHEHVCYS